MRKGKSKMAAKPMHEMANVRRLEIVTNDRSKKRQRTARNHVMARNVAA